MGEVELYTFFSVVSLSYKNKKRTKPNQSHPLDPTPLMETWLQVVVSEFQVEFPGERCVCVEDP